MERDIKNKIIVVTGGAEGIGFQLIRSFLNAEAKLAVLLDINEAKANKAVEELTTEFGPNKVVYIKCNVIEDLEETYSKIHDQFGIIDVLINNAGIEDEKVPENCVDVNLTATIKWSLKFMELMKKDGNGNGGTILNIASIFGYQAAYFAPVYVATKFGVVGFTKALGHDKHYSKTKVRVIAICPGFTKTSLTKVFNDPGREELMKIKHEFLWQSAKNVAENAVEVFKVADSGTLWEIEGGVLREVK